MFRRLALIAYRALCAIAWLLLVPLLLYLSTKPKYRRSIPARFFPFLRVFTLESSGFCKDFYPHFWLHACSFGEIKSLEPIIQALAQAAPTRNILLTTTTQTGFDLAQSTYINEPRIRVEFLPFEIFLSFYARRLKQLQALVVTEAELWLELFYTTKALGAKTLLINARISTRSYPKYRRFRFFYRVLFSCVDEVFSQTQADSTRLAELGARHIEVLGNLKLLSPIHISRTYPKPSNRLVIVAASTHKGEEELVLEAFSTLKKLESSKMDLACGLESRISSPRCVDRHSSLISLRGSKNPDSSSTILESQGGFTEQAENKTTASKKAAEIENQPQALESTFENNAEKSQSVASLEKMDSSPSPSDSKIVELELGLFKDSQGRALPVRNRAESAEIADSSPQAESPKTQKVDSSLLILAPRHPERFTQVASLLAGYPFASARFSHDPNALTNPSLDVVLLDTLGELNNCYAIADIVILGGAFIQAGGHNPLEPAFFGTKLISGRAIFNQEALFACVDGYTLCEASELESTLLAHQSLPHTSYKHTQASLSTLIQAITTHKD